MRKLNRFQEWLVKGTSQYACEHKKTFIEDDKEICWYCGKEYKRPNEENLKVFGFFWLIILFIIMIGIKGVRKMNLKNNYWLIAIITAIVILLISLFIVKKVGATSTGTAQIGDECNVHAEDESHICVEGLVCVPQNDNSEGNGKCGSLATATPTASPSATPTLEPTSTPTATPSCEEDEDCFVPTPTPTPAPTQQPSNPTNQNVGAPICQDGSIVALPIAFKVVRQGDIATLTWFKTGGDLVNIYYKELGETSWTHAVGDVPNVDPSNTFVIHDLVPSIGYVFALEQHQGCGGGQLVQSVIVDGASYLPVVFNFSYWQWSK